MIDATTAKRLSGVKVLVTRPRRQAAGLADLIAELGGHPILMPAIEIGPSAKKQELEEALKRLAEFDWLVVTSVNGVAAIAEILAEIPSHVKVAAIGPATAEAFAASFRAPDVVPSEYISEAIAPAMGEVAGKRILLARADIARKNLAIDLAGQGADVTEVEAYSIKRAPLYEISAKPDIITATSSSAARHTVENLEGLGLSDWADIPWACIGPVAAETARELGCNVVTVANEYTMKGLVEALVQWVHR